MKLVRVFLALVGNNSSLIIAPLSSFLIYLVIVARSDFLADTLYFFLISAFALCTPIDGGLPYRIASGGCLRIGVIRMCRRVLTNLLKVLPLILIALLATIWFSPFGESANSVEIAFYACLGLCVVILKVLVDAVRVASLKSTRRVATDQLASLFGMFRLLIAVLVAGTVPFFPVFAVVLLIELICLLSLNDVSLGMLIAEPAKSLRRRSCWDRAYVKANLAYNSAFNVDRLVAFFFLSPESYRALIGVSSLYSMAILPHKLMENELLFPSSNRIQSPVLRTVIPAALCGLGSIGVVFALYMLGIKFSINFERTAQFTAVAWVSITCYYNRIWSISLRDFSIAYLAQVNLIASILAIISAFLVSDIYQMYVPVGLVMYSLANFVGVLRGSSSRSLDVVTYACACVAALVFSICALQLI